MILMILMILMIIENDSTEEIKMSTIMKMKMVLLTIIKSYDTEF